MSVIEAMARAYHDAFQAWPGPIDAGNIPAVRHAAMTAALTALAENITPGMVEAALDSVNPIGCCLMDEIDAAVVLRAMCAAAAKGEG